MPLRDLLKKKDKINEDGAGEPAQAPATLPQDPPPEFKFIRSTTDIQEVINPPSFPTDDEPASFSSTPHLTVDKSKRSNVSPSRRVFHLHKSSHNSSPSESPDPSPALSSPPSTKTDDRRLSRRLEEKLHIHPRSRSRATSATSSHVPENLPNIEKTGAEDPEAEAEWEKRALLLAKENERSRPGSPSAHGDDSNNLNGAGRPRSISDAGGDVNIQEAIRLHEGDGEDLKRSTGMFKKLADPKGENNALAQVLYGLALRHGWGCEPDQPTALTYLSLAASNSALVESAALSTGILKGGAAKGELVLAIFELGNSFRNGWGCEKDAVAARNYYETAANLGDTDAMGEVAWCYLEGFGGKKDKFKAAQYLKMAEKKGIKEPGNSWIWKDKYSEPSKS